MAVKKIDQIKRGKLFRISDLIVYGVLAAIILALFLTVFLTRDKSSAESVEVLYRGERVFLYDFSTGKYDAASPGRIKVVYDTDGRLEIEFTEENGAGYNRIVFDRNEKSVKVTEANCSSRKDCVYTPAIKSNSEVISCAPHSLLIRPVSIEVEDDGGIVIG